MRSSEQPTISPGLRRALLILAPLAIGLWALVAIGIWQLGHSLLPLLTGTLS